MVVTQRLLTAEEYLALPDDPGRRFELVRGELVEVPFASAVHSWIGGLIYRLLIVFADQHQLGFVFGDGVGYITARDPDIVRGPDVSFVSRLRWPQSTLPNGHWPFAPDLAVEITSRSDRPGKVRANAVEYLAGGSRLVWVVRPDHHSVTVYLADGTIQELGPEDDLDGDAVLPGFRVRVADLFAGPA